MEKKGKIQFAVLQTLLSASKLATQPKPNAPLALAPERNTPYIEPFLRKDIFDLEKPSIILISAVGATGKSALAQTLGNASGLPLLDLSKHKAVGDSTLSGLLTTSFLPTELGSVIAGLAEGTYGVIIDGLDEGRSKTTEQAFDAFLDDIASLCRGSSRPTFVMLGRTAVVDDCWLKLEERGIKTGLLSIEPFNEKLANDYIDKVSGRVGTHQNATYTAAKETILQCLSSSFAASSGENFGSFLSFIGYPPVLDAVATLLREDGNFHKIQTELSSQSTSDKEVQLLVDISEFILRREQSEKVWLNIVRSIVENTKQNEPEKLRELAFNIEEQAVRLLSFVLGQELRFPLFQDVVLDAQYEEQLATFFHLHPFLDGKQFRNAVFEAYCLATAFFADSRVWNELAAHYLDIRKPTYHLVYMLGALAKDRAFPFGSLRSLIAGAIDFRSRNSSVDLDVDGVEGGEIEITIGITAGSKLTDDSAKTRRQFSFISIPDSDGPVNLGDTLADAFIQIPADLALNSPAEIKLIGPVEVTCMSLTLNSSRLTVSKGQGPDSNSVSFTCLNLHSQLQLIAASGMSLQFNVVDKSGLGYPLSEFLHKSSPLTTDASHREKYLRLRKILTHFRSHSKGQLAKYADKVEHERVAGNLVGGAVLRKLTIDGILYKEGNFYFVNPEIMSDKLGVSWSDLRNGVVTEKLVAYLAEA